MSNEQENLAPLSDAQMEIMNIIWESGETTVNDIWNTLKKQRNIARNTVQTLLSRMEDKKWIMHHKKGNSFFYNPCVERKKSLPKILDNFLNNVFGGSANNLIMALFQNKDISQKEIEKIKSMIDTFEKEKK